MPEGTPPVLDRRYMGVSSTPIVTGLAHDPESLLMLNRLAAEREVAPAEPRNIIYRGIKRFFEIIRPGN